MDNIYNLSSKERIALDIVFKSLGESRYNRTAVEYIELASKLPKIESAYAEVEGQLKKIAEKKTAPYEICYFKQGDVGHFYVPYPTSLSRETIRKAIKKFKTQARMLEASLKH